MKHSLLLILFFCTSSLVFSQTVHDKQIIKKYTAGKQEAKLFDQVRNYNLERKKRLDAVKKNNLIPLDKFVKDGVIYQAKDVLKDGTIIYNVTYNYGSGRTIRADRVYSGGTLGLDLDGEGIVAGIWDGGLPLTTHQEFIDENGNSRAGLFGDEYEITNHTTHVTGTVIAGGKEENARGIAYKTKTINASWLDDAEEMVEFASQGHIVSNHSYGSFIEILPKWILGAYNEEAAIMDNIAYTYPYYQIVKASGNDRRAGMAYHPEMEGYQLISGFSNSKNILTVGAVNQLLNYREPENVGISEFSNFGPTDDGRIKPNVVAKGVAVYSSIATEDGSQYDTMNGTSMAAPAVTGAIVLLQQHYKNINDMYMTSATVRGLIQHTALEAGYDDGPDYIFGWGLVDVSAAALAISGNGSTSLIEENILENGQSYTKDIYAGGDTPLMVSISWTDPSGPVNEEEIQDWREKSLVNDLDVRLTDEEGNIYYPWRLDVEKFKEPATQADNDVDNFERIDIYNSYGKYTVTVSHKATLVEEYGSTQSAKQDYTLIVTGGSSVPSRVNKEVNDELIYIYPGIVEDGMNIYSPAQGNYSIYNLSGKEVATGFLNSGTSTINTVLLESGIYLIKISTGNKVETKKIIKK